MNIKLRIYVPYYYALSGNRLKRKLRHRTLFSRLVAMPKERKRNERDTVQRYYRRAIIVTDGT